MHARANPSFPQKHPVYLFLVNPERKSDQKLPFCRSEWGGFLLEGIFFAIFFFLKSTSRFKSTARSANPLEGGSSECRVSSLNYRKIESKEWGIEIEQGSQANKSGRSRESAQPRTIFLSYFCAGALLRHEKI
jgi:hypothetical protein